MANGLLDGFWYTEVFSSVSTNVSTRGVAKGVDLSPRLVGSPTTNPSITDTAAAITNGKM